MMRWISIRSRPDRDLEEEYLFTVLRENGPVLSSGGGSIVFPNGWKFEKANIQDPLILTCWTVHPVTKIRVYRLDSFDGAIVFEHTDNAGKEHMKWCLKSSYDSGSPLTIYSWEGVASSIETEEFEGFLEIV